MLDPPASAVGPEPLLILGPPCSGASAVAGLLHHGSGVSMGELVAPTIESPLGSFETLGVADAQRRLLSQMERDLFCPPTSFDPASLDLEPLQAELDELRRLPGVWAVKDSATAFLLPAWAAVGVGSVRLVGVVRPPHDAVRSMGDRSGVGDYWAEATIDAYLQRLVELSRSLDLAIVEFSNSGTAVLAQLAELAERLGLPWDHDAAAPHFDGSLVQHQSPHAESNSAFDELMKIRHDTNTAPIQTADIRSIGPMSAPEWPLAIHVGTRPVVQRNELWQIAGFETARRPSVAEVVLQGSPAGSIQRPGIHELQRIEIESPLTIGTELHRRRLRPDGLIAHGVLADRSHDDVDYFLRAVHLMTTPFAELVLDVPAPTGTALAVIEPAPVAQPSPDRVVEIATECGWQLLLEQRLSPGRVGLVLRKQITVDDSLQQLRTEIALQSEILAAIDLSTARAEPLVEPEPEVPAITPSQLDSALRRADVAERDLQRLRSRRSVRIALAVAQPFRGVFRVVRGRRDRVM